MGVLIASKLAWVHPLFELTTHTLWHVGIVLLAGSVVLHCWMRFHAKRWLNEQGGKNFKFGLLMMGYYMLNGIFLAELQPWQAIPLTSIPWQAISKLDKAKVDTEAKKTAGTGEGLLRVMSWNVWIGVANHPGAGSGCLGIDRDWSVASRVVGRLAEGGVSLFEMDTAERCERNRDVIADPGDGVSRGGFSRDRNASD